MKKTAMILTVFSAMVFLTSCGTDMQESSIQSSISTAAGSMTTETETQTSVTAMYTSNVTNSTSASSKVSTVKKMIVNTLDIEGEWLYQPNNNETAGTMKINTNGTFDYTNAETGNTIHGTVMLEHITVNQETSEDLWYCFYESGKFDPWIFAPKDNTSKENGILPIGSEGDARLVRDSGQAIISETIPNETTSITTETTAILTETVKTAAASSAVTTATANPIEKIVGHWKYLNPDGSAGSAIDVFEDGSFTEMGLSWVGSMTGTVKRNKEWYQFYDKDGNLYLAFKPESAKAKSFIDDRGDGGKLVNALDAAENTENQPKPNAEGLYAATNPEELGIRVDSLAGKWIQEDCEVEVLTVKQGDDPYTGTFTYNDGVGTVISGNISIRYLLNPGNEKEYVYAFYQDNGVLWYSFDIELDLETDHPENHIVGYMSGFPHFVRQ